MIETFLTKRLNLDVPLICGGMHRVGYPQLAAAVSEAGALGTITALSQDSPELLRVAINKVRELTDRSFSVNVTILPALVPGDVDGMIQVICEEAINDREKKGGLKAIEISAGSPKKYMPKLKEAGLFVIHKSATLKHALKAQAAGVDLIEMAGFESSVAGRTSEDDIGTWVLATKAAQNLTTPFVVSGASATGRQLAMALTCGAVGVVFGTRFLATKEAPIHPSVKAAVADPKNDEFSSTLVLRSFNNSTRVFKNSVAKEIIRLEDEADGDFSKIAPLASGERSKAMFDPSNENSDPNDAMWSCGMSIGLIDDVISCKELVSRVSNEAEERLKSASSMVKISKL